MPRLDGKVALITGGAGGMGSAQARLLAREGAAVVIADVRDELGSRLEAEIAASEVADRKEIRGQEVRLADVMAQRAEVRTEPVDRATVECLLEGPREPADRPERPRKLAIEHAQERGSLRVDAHDSTTRSHAYEIRSCHGSAPRALPDPIAVRALTVPDLRPRFQFGSIVRN